MLKMKKTNRQTIVHMTQHRQLKNTQHEPHQKLGVISERVNRSCSTCGTRRVAYVITNPINSLISVGHINALQKTFLVNLLYLNLFVDCSCMSNVVYGY